eukprot:TRINITY_DN2383_c0_g2_i3.p1 TRINITY_DN2383_c0_g2~~TRINITY_DN2383_c0_g2_i3.p1  ORF type:complete len:508 (+),score=100.57 TRINITY_DN2383_c0_g2_i3:3-1526(+)
MRLRLIFDTKYVPKDLRKCWIQLDKDIGSIGDLKQLILARYLNRERSPKGIPHAIRVSLDDFNLDSDQSISILKEDECISIKFVKPLKPWKSKRCGTKDLKHSAKRVKVQPTAEKSTSSGSSSSSDDSTSDDSSSESDSDSDSGTDSESDSSSGSDAMHTTAPAITAASPAAPSPVTPASAASNGKNIGGSKQASATSASSATPVAIMNGHGRGVPASTPHQTPPAVTTPQSAWRAQMLGRGRGVVTPQAATPSPQQRQWPSPAASQPVEAQQFQPRASSMPQQQQQREQPSSTAAVVQRPPKPVRNYQTLEVCSWPPRRGDVLAFRHLEISESYSPELSAFKEGTVEDVQGHAVTIRIHDAFLPVPPAPEQPAVVLESPQSRNTPRRKTKPVLEVPEIENPITEEWTALTDPRIVSRVPVPSFSGGVVRLPANIPAPPGKHHPATSAPPPDKQQTATSAPPPPDKQHSADTELLVGRTATARADVSEHEPTPIIPAASEELPWWNV